MTELATKRILIIMAIATLLNSAISVFAIWRVSSLAEQQELASRSHHSQMASLAAAGESLAKDCLAMAEAHETRARAIEIDAATTTADHVAMLLKHGSMIRAMEERLAESELPEGLPKTVDSHVFAIANHEERLLNIGKTIDIQGEQISVLTKLLRERNE